MVDVIMIEHRIEALLALAQAMHSNQAARRDDQEKGEYLPPRAEEAGLRDGSRRRGRQRHVG